MPLIQVTTWSGKSDETKAALIKAVTEAVSRVLNIEADLCQVILYEVPPANWGVGGIPDAQRSYRALKTTPSGCTITQPV
jgi:4-oxalocrotonate tautomerase